VVEACGLLPDSEPVADIRNGRCGPENNRWKGGKPEWVCATCGKTFRAWLRSGKPRVTCSRECQRQWQKANPPINIRWARYRAKQQTVI
jgi:DNA-directed RNA polymerase subunit RPC12/RpoP